MSQVIRLVTLKV